LVKYADISFKASPSEIQAIVQQAFSIGGFQVQMVTASAGRAEKGSKGANVLLGALATHHVIDFEIFPSPQGGILRLVKAGSGASGGLLGMRKANKEFEKIVEVLASWFKNQGSLLEVKKT